MGLFAFSLHKCCILIQLRKGRGEKMSKILVVDDDPHIRELIGVFLRAEGFDICEASDGVEV